MTIGLLNAIVECLMTGLFTALFILLFSIIGWLPMLILKEEDENKK